MASDAEDLASLQQTRSNIIAQLATITTDTPEYNVDGQMVKPGRTYLFEQLALVNGLIADADGGFQVFSVTDVG